MNIKPVGKLPKKYKTLVNLKIKDAGFSEYLGFASMVSYVRHKYTNYEDVLLALPQCPEGATQDEMMAWYFENQRRYEPIKREATELAVDLLSDAYGDEWRK